MSALARRRFDHLATELSVELGVLVPRHALWLACAREVDSAASAAAFCAGPLAAFLADCGLPALSAQRRERLRRTVARFDASRRTPEEIVGGLFADLRGH